MASIGIVKQTGRGVALAAALLASAAFVSGPNRAEARVSTGAAVGIGLGSFALGTALGAAANPYYAPYSYPYAYPPAPAYYPPPPAYYAPRSCWDPYYRRYYPC